MMMLFQLCYGALHRKYTQLFVVDEVLKPKQSQSITKSNNAEKILVTHSLHIILYCVVDVVVAAFVDDDAADT